MPSLTCACWLLGLVLLAWILAAAQNQLSPPMLIGQWKGEWVSKGGSLGDRGTVYLRITKVEGGKAEGTIYIHDSSFYSHQDLPFIGDIAEAENPNGDQTFALSLTAAHDQVSYRVLLVSENCLEGEAKGTVESIVYFDRVGK